ncbi:MAG: cytochrome c [Chthoniobacterales bacterium]
MSSQFDEPGGEAARRREGSEFQGGFKSGHEEAALHSEFSPPEIGDAPLPRWVLGLIGLGIFWAGAYLFSFSGGFSAEVFDYQPKFGVVGNAAAPPDPKVIGQHLFSANCVTCHQATGLGVEGQYPPIAGSEFVNGPANNRLIAIVLKGLQGPVQVAGKTVNNAMQAWEGQYTDQQLAAILTYERSAFGNNAPPIPPEAVKQMRAQLKDRNEQWTYAELMKLPEKDLTQAGGQPAQPAKPGTQPQGQGGANQPPTPAPSPAPTATPQRS